MPTKDLSQLSKDELQSEINALKLKLNWIPEEFEYFDLLHAEYYRRIEDDVKSIVTTNISSRLRSCF
jgi:hypothetical protein